HREQDLAARRMESRRERRGLAEIPPEAHAVYPGLLQSDFLDHFPRTILAAVIDKDSFEFKAGVARRVLDFRTKELQTLFLVIERDDDRNHAAGPCPESPC